MQQNYIFVDSLKSAVHVSGDSFSCFQEHFVYTAFWNNAPTVLPPTDRQQSRCIVPKSCIYSQSAPEEGRNFHPKHAEQT